MTTPSTEITTETNNGLLAMQGRRFRVPGDQVNKGTSALGDRERSALRWLHAYCAERDLSRDDVAKLIRKPSGDGYYSWDSIYQSMTGRRDPTTLGGLVDAIEQFRRIEESRAVGGRLDFIETDLSRRIWRVCDAALEYQRIAYILGESQIGKTANLVRYAADHNHGSTIYVRTPTGGALGNFLERLAVALRITPQQKERELRARILGSFDERMLLIVDEAHQCLSSGNSVRATYTIEFLRELHDTCRCGMVIAATPVFAEEMERGRWSGVLRQSKLRRLLIRNLPSTPPKADLDQFARKYGLEPATGDAAELQRAVIRDEALGMWLTVLRMGAKVAARRGEPMTWEHVLSAHASLRKLEAGD